MSSYYQGPKFYPYGKHGNLSDAGKYGPIGVNRTNFVKLTQIRGYMPDEIKSVEWIVVGSCAFNAFIPQYFRINDTNKYLKEVSDEVTPESFYWNNRMIGALADHHYNEQWFGLIDIKKK